MSSRSTEAASRRSTERRTHGVQRQGRAAKVVASVLKATGEELNRVGYANLKIEQVAERAGVNKTTVYRRWPTKAILVSETLDSHFDEERELPDTGSLRGDFLEYLTSMATLSSATMWRGIMSALSGRSDPEVETVARKLHLRERNFRTRLVQRAMDRGQLPGNINAELIGDMCSAPILRRLLTFKENVSEEYITAVIDTTLAGAVVMAMQQGGAEQLSFGKETQAAGETEQHE